VSNDSGSSGDAWAEMMGLVEELRVGIVDIVG
jgi:hypothetical protein